jgi:hypothetical protein
MKNLLLFSLLILATRAYGQSMTSLNVSESEEYKDDVPSFNVIAIYTSEGGDTVVARNAKKDFLIDIFDSKLDKTFSKVIESNKREHAVGDLFVNNQLKLFTVDAPHKDLRMLYCHTLDLDTKAYTKTLIFETEVEKKQNLFGSRKNHKTSFALSPDGTYFAIATDNIRKNKNSYTIRVYDSETEKLIYQKVYQEDKERNFEHNDLHIDNDATVYSLGKMFFNGTYDKKLNGDANYQFVLNEITKEKNTTLAIDLEQDHVQSLSISQNNGQLHLMGFYSELNVNRIKGGCDFLIDTSNFKVQSKISTVLPKQVYEDLYGYRTADRKDKKKKELRNFYADYTLTDSAGGTFLIAEEFYITQTYVTNGVAGGGTWQITYHYDDILILKFDPSGELAWGRSIFKRDGNPSYNAFLKDDQLHIILNSGKNLTEKSDGRTKVSQGWFESSSLYDIEYTLAGEVSYNKIQDNRGNEFYLPFYGTYELNKFIMMSAGRKKKTFRVLE